MITIHHWNPSDKKLHTLAPEGLLARREAWQASTGILWIDLCQPTEEEERLVFEQFFKIHPLSVEDITRLRREPDAPPHLPKVEEFRDYLLVILNPLTQQFSKVAEDAAHDAPRIPPLTQLSAVLTHNVLITHHYAQMTCIDFLRSHVGRHETQFERGPDYLFHLILDATVDEFVPVLDYIEDTLDAFEVRIVEQPTQAIFLRLLRIKREIILLRKTLIAEREVLVRLARGEFTLVNARETAYYRNVYDHLVRFAELIDTSRDMASDLMQTYLSAQSNHLNQIMKVLTMISTIVLPMTLIAGVYGMNFDLLLPNEVGFFIAVGLMILSGAISLAFFYWRRWL